MSRALFAREVGILTLRNLPDRPCELTYKFPPILDTAFSPPEGT